MTSTALRDRVRESDVRQLQRQAEPVLMALQAATRELRASARALQSATHAARRPTIRQASALVATGMLLSAILFLAMARGPCALMASKPHEHHPDAHTAADTPPPQDAHQAQPLRYSTQGFRMVRAVSAVASASSTNSSVAKSNVSDRSSRRQISDVRQANSEL